MPLLAELIRVGAHCYKDFAPTELVSAPSANPEGMKGLSLGF
jgi:hypothetical protein